MDILRFRDLVSRISLKWVVLGTVLGLLGASPVAVALRGSDQAALVDSLPDISGSGFSQFEGVKLTPLEDYHSGDRNAAFYLFHRRTCRLRLEYYSIDTSRKSIEVVFLRNHKFYAPRLLENQVFTEKGGVFSFPVQPGIPLVVPFEIDHSGVAADIFNVAVNSLRDPTYNPSDSIVTLNSTSLYHANIVRWAYYLTGANAWRSPDVSQRLDVTSGRETAALKNRRSIAVINKDKEPREWAICQPGEDPIFVRLRPFESATFRNVLNKDQAPVVVLGKPFTRTEGFLGLPYKSVDIAYFFHPG